MPFQHLDPPLPDDVVPVWVIYNRPADAPEHEYVLRPQWGNRDGTITAYRGAWVGETLPEIRDKLLAIHPGAVLLGRQEEDDPVIVETWI